MNRTEWLKARGRGIGGSEASAIVGCNPYMNNQELWRIKTGRAVPPDISDKPYVKYGVLAEAPQRLLFMLDYPEYDLVYSEYESLTHPEYPYIIGTLDGILIDKKTGEKGIYEGKTTEILASQQREKWVGGVPDNYYVQVLHYLLVTGYAFAILNARLKTKIEGEPRIYEHRYRFKRAEVKEDLDYLLAEEVKFWDAVTADREPDLRLPPL